MQRANELGLICFSSPFDETAADFLEISNFPQQRLRKQSPPLITKAASTGKPLIISTGMASLGELN